jgi:hypothetical protein
MKAKLNKYCLKIDNISWWHIAIKKKVKDHFPVCLATMHDHVTQSSSKNMSRSKICPFSGHLTRSGVIFPHHNRVGVILLASREQRPEILLNILQCIGHPPTSKRKLTQNVNSANVEKPWLKGKRHIPLLLSPSDSLELRHSSDWPVLDHKEDRVRQEPCPL